MFRSYAPTYSALSGDGARRRGGRWNPAHSFPVIYTALDEATVTGEVARTLARGAISKPGRRVIARIRVKFSRVLDLTDPAILNALGIDVAELLADDVTTTQDLGEAANYLGYEAILAPSATGSGRVLAILMTNRAASSDVDVVEAGNDLANSEDT